MGGEWIEGIVETYNMEKNHAGVLNWIKIVSLTGLK
jgi:hypothetical protein